LREIVYATLCVFARNGVRYALRLCAKLCTLHFASLREKKLREKEPRAPPTSHLQQINTIIQRDTPKSNGRITQR
jgi:hypothetical protein